MQAKNDLRLFSLISLIFLLPFLNFINNNIQEIDIIIGKSFFFLIFFLFLLLITLAKILSLIFKKKINFYNSLLISVLTYWIFFNHNTFKITIKAIYNNFGLQDFFNKFEFDFFSEISLLLIIFLSIYFAVLIYKNNYFFKNFLYIFFYLNFIVIIFQIVSYHFKSNNYENIAKKDEIIFVDYLKKDKPNIYFFILDGMMPIKEFSKYYKIDTQNFLNHVKKNEYLYLNNTKNIYNNTKHSLSAIFYLDEIFDNQNKLKEKAKILYPSLLRQNNVSDLLNNLYAIDYEFKWAGNFFAYCPKFNLRYCLNSNKKKIIDYYLYINFFKQTPLLQTVYNLSRIFNYDLNKYFFYRINDGIGRLTEFLENKDTKLANDKSTFYFIHHMSPHWPYITSKDCSYKFFPGKVNYEGYKEAYLCNLTKIKKFTDYINQIDPNSIVIFQSDHSWQMSAGTESARNIFSLIKIPNDCQYNQDTNLNNVNVLRLVLSCITGNNPKFLSN